MGIIRLYLKENVLEAARKRFEFMYNEFEHIYVAFSGGKDSTVCLQLAIEAATKLNRLPVRVLFVDQEAEWQTVIDYVRLVMHDPRVKPFWLQVPIKMNNAASVDEPWMYCWQPGREADWMRPKEPDSIHDNVYGTDLLKGLFGYFGAYHHPKQRVVQITGMRCEESPSRSMSLTYREVYPGVTWGAKDTKYGRKHYHLSPIFDWSYKDVWKYIHENNFDYCPLYDLMYQHGLSLHSMRVSCVTHEQATKTLYFMQEIEPETWNKLTMRVSGINSVAQLRGDFYIPDELPFMFKTWEEYRDHLLRYLTDDTGRKFFVPLFDKYDKMYEHAAPGLRVKMVKVQISMILRNDWEEGTGLKAFRLVNPDPARAQRRVDRRARILGGTEIIPGLPGPASGTR